MTPKLDAAETMSTMDDDDDAVIKGSQEVVSLAYCCRVPSQSSGVFLEFSHVQIVLVHNTER